MIDKLIESISNFKKSTEIYLDALIEIISWPIAVLIPIFIFVAILNMFIRWLMDKINKGIKSDSHDKENNYDKQVLEKQIKKLKSKLEIEQIRYEQTKGNLTKELKIKEIQLSTVKKK